jgi:hypothetical protein
MLERGLSPEWQSCSTAQAAGIPTAVCNQTLRATGITAYLDNGGSLKYAHVMAVDGSPGTTKLYAPTARSPSMRSRKSEFRISFGIR